MARKNQICLTGIVRFPLSLPVDIKSGLTAYLGISAHNSGTSYSHMRMLECFIMFIAGALGDVAGELDSLIDALEALAAQKQLTFKNIRNAVLQVRNGGIGFWYRPPRPLECRLMDIGYMQDGKFIVLENLSQVQPFSDPGAVYRRDNSRDIDWVDEFGVRSAFTKLFQVDYQRLNLDQAITQLFRLLP